MPPPLHGGAAVAVVAEPGRSDLTRELLGAAAGLAAALDGHAVVLDAAPDPVTLGTWGADVVVHLDGPVVEEDVAGTLAGWAAETGPRVVLLAATDWGHEVTGACHGGPRRRVARGCRRG